MCYEYAELSQLFNSKGVFIHLMLFLIARLKGAAYVIYIDDIMSLLSQKNQSH